MNRFATVVAGRRSKFLVLGAWVLLVVALGPFAGRFEQAQRNEPSSFLPEGAESVEVLEAAAGFPSGEVTPAVAVFRDPDGIGGARSAVERARGRVENADLEGVERLAPVVYSRDGTGALFAVPIRAEGDEEVLIGAVEDVRGLVRQELPQGVEVEVTGPAAFSADASKAFDGINTTLLFATVGLVFVLLVLIYRSPIFWALPLVSVLFAESVVRGLGYLLAEAGAVINGQTGGILLVLVFGAGTDYALLLTARYREELHRVEDKHEAMAIALRRAGPAIVASAGTVVAALLCLCLAQVNSVSGLGPVGAMGVAVAAAAMLTVLPALLLIGGRRAFWPFVPRYGGVAQDPGRGAWGRLGRADRAAAPAGVDRCGRRARRPRARHVHARRRPDDGELLPREGRGGRGPAPARAIVPRRGERAGGRARPERARSGSGARGCAERAAASRPSGRPSAVRPGCASTSRSRRIRSASARSPPSSRFATRLRAAAGPGVLVGGPTAEEADLRSATDRDTRLLVPLVLLVVFTILVLLLRSLAAPAMLMGTVVLSFLAAIGGSLLLFEAFTDFPARTRATR